MKNQCPEAILCRLKVSLSLNSISYCNDNIKCDSASNAPKCPLTNVQKFVIKLANTSTMLFPLVAKTLSKCLRG
jgi:hypothetical protein